MDYLWSFVPPSIRNISTHIDYIGQKHAEHLFQIVLIVHGIVGFIVGYITQQLSYSIYILGFGFVLSCLLVLPPWPQFRAHPLKWQTVAANAIVDNKSEKSKTKKNK